MTVRALISGAGIAGLTLAHLLAARGDEVLVVEKAPAQRSSGNPVDVRNDAMAVAERIGVSDDIRRAATQVTAFEFVNHTGSRIARVRGVSNNGPDDVEIPRGDLAAALQRSLPMTVETIFADSIAALHQHDNHVSIALDSGRRERVDLVIGADGLHSQVRALVFGPEDRFIRRHGVYIGAAATGVEPTNMNSVLIYNAPGIAAVVHPGRGRELALLLFRDRSAIDVRDPVEYRAAVRRKFTGRGWRSDELVERFLATDDVYFDAVSSVRLNRWTSGRITLLGDAAASVSVFGEGSSSAMTGAAILADSLSSTGEVTTALRRYESMQSRQVRGRIAHVGVSARFTVPATRAAIVARNLALQVIR